MLLPASETLLMLRVTLLGSGSSGNALVLDNGETAIVIDAGFSARLLEKKLVAAGHHPESVTALVLTHEHTDHARGALKAAQRWNWQLHASTGTCQALVDSDPGGCGLDAGASRILLHELPANGTDIGGIRITPHGVQHDAAEPVAIVAEDQRSGARAGVATDLGHAPATLQKAFEKLDILVLEANHDTELLRYGPYPYHLKRRIASRSGHLSNADAAHFAAAVAHKGLRHLILAHLSETNNTPQLAVTAVRDVLAAHGNCSIAVSAAERRSQTGPFQGHASAAARRDTAVQLLLPLLT